MYRIQIISNEIVYATKYYILPGKLSELFVSVVPMNAFLSWKYFAQPNLTKITVLSSNSPFSSTHLVKWDTSSLEEGPVVSTSLLISIRTPANKDISKHYLYCYC